jgi:mono/diheme cytochrome c family protein
MSIKRSLLSVPLRFSNLALVFFLFVGVQAFAADPAVSDSDEAIAAGQSIFNANCRACHRLDSKSVGPALRGVTERRGVDWSKSFIRNSQQMIQAGDPQAVAIFKEYNNLAMPAHTFLSDQELDNLLSYIEYGDKAVTDVVGAEGVGATAAEGGIPSEYLTVILAVLVALLLLILIVLGLIVSVLSKYLEKQPLEEDDREFISQKTDFKAILKSDAFILITTAIVVTIIVKVAIDGLYSVGIQQGYAPTQPIAYSHELHAGQYEIPCQYCHTGVEIGRSANIPSANICMNCHTHIQNVDGQDGMSPEIAKIYAAIENDQPIEWVRVHNLPDLAYFDHSQHVAVGGIACQTCHGPIEEMEVVYQHSSLTMGWCIDCHRETKVDFSNNYYHETFEFHKDHENLTLSQIGGIECSRCHY